MLNLIIKRLLQACLVVWLMATLVFFALHVIGSPIDILLSPDASEQDRERLIADLGLNLPLWQQYLLFLQGMLHGDLGRSYVFNQPALTLILQRFPATLELAVSATVLAIVIALPLGLYAGLKPDSLLSKSIMAGSILGFSLPTFWAGLLLIMFFSVGLGWLPSGGRGEMKTVLGIQWSFLTLDGLRHLILPAVNLALFKASLLLRLTRAGVREEYSANYLRLAKARGLSSLRINFIHLLKNIVIPLITVIGMEFGSVISFSVVTETIFAWPGMGKLIIDSINMLDRPVIVAYLMIIVTIIVVINLVVDIISSLLNPRIRLSAGGNSHG